MWSLKKCPRCRGDLYIDENEDKWCKKCLQCGYEQELEEALVIKTSRGIKKKPEDISKCLKSHRILFFSQG
jgi:DNA-directed RNA polymerase subunit M/transcription elongation factor TFIIS